MTETELRPPIIYLSGPMSGHENYNYNRFNMEARRLRDMGYVVINPAESMGGFQDLPKALYMGLDIQYVLTVADAVAVIEGWQESPGAKLEVIVATALEKPVMDVQTLEPITITGYEVHTDGHTE